MKKILIGLLGVCSAWAWAQTPLAPRVMESGSTRIEVLGRAHPGPVGVAPSQARVVFYAPDNLALAGATSIFINGGYHTSLLKGAYSDMCYSPQRVEIAARQIEVGQRPKDQPDATLSLQASGGKVVYLRVQEQNGRPSLQVVAPAQAENELVGKRQQIHTISRVRQDCIEVPLTPVVAVAPVAPVPEVPKRHTLSADTLFMSVRSDRDGMKPEGLVAIDRLVAQLNKEYVRIDAMTIVGHADPLGNNALNERLAKERADTVRQYIESNLQIKAPMTAVGRGSSELVVNTCSRQRTPESRLCNQPNRRVDVEVSGLRR
jgi:OmpA-OmpF porin, OOP family